MLAKIKSAGRDFQIIGPDELRAAAEESKTMIRNGDILRFTPDEIAELRSAGVDVTGVRTIEDFGAAVATWCDVLDKARPDLLDKVARAMAEARGVKLPPKLKVYDGGTEEGKS